MVNYLKLIQIIGFVVRFSHITPSFCFVIHRRLHSRYNIGCLYDTSEPPRQVIPADEEIVKKLAERHKDEIQRYLDPLGSGLGKQISQQELEDTFGKPMSRENLAKRERKYDKPHPYELPIIPPTSKLPYFVNFDFPQNQTREVQSHLHQDETPDLFDEKEINIALEPLNVEPSTESSLSKSEESEISEQLDKSQEKDTKDVEVKNEQSTSTYDDKNRQPTFNDGLPRDLSTVDPLRELIERNEDYPDLHEEYGPKWYLSNKKNELTQVDLEDGWSILPCGKVYKQILQPSQLDEIDRKNPNDESCITFMFKMMDAKTNTIITESEDVGGSMITTYMNELSPIFQKCFKAMNTGEQAEFIFHVSEYNPDNMIIDELTDVTWIRLWINLWESHNPKERWWGLGPGDAHLYPEKTDSKLSKEQMLEQETDELASQIETELNTNPSSPLWADVMEKMTTSQKESFVKHFDKKLEDIERMKCSEFSGSRAFGENIKSSGQYKGYDVGHQVGGVSKLYSWRETPFMMYIAIPVIPGVRSEHVKLNLTSTHVTLSIADKIVIDDDLTGSIDLDTTGIWAMSDAASEHPPLNPSDERLSNPTTQLSRYDEYDIVTKRPSILLFLKKSSNSLNNWGAPFVNI